jgi:hypothetical protein
VRALALAVALAALAGAQATRDFLTSDEVAQVRETAQDPVARLRLYLQFAKVRVDMVKSTLATDKPGRSRFVHDTLEDYTKVMETIDTVTDDALKRGKDVSEALGEMADTGKELLAELEKIDESAPADLNRFKFVLTTAIDTTRDSIELAEKDVGERTKAAKQRDLDEKKQRELMMTPEEVKKRKEAGEKAAEQEAKDKRKIPTLRKKGEVAPTKR